MFVHWSIFTNSFFSLLWLNHAVVWSVRLIPRFLLQFVSLLQVSAITKWSFFIRGCCLSISLTWAGMVSTLDLFSLMSLSQGWLWSSSSFFINPYSQFLAPEYFTGLHFFLLIHSGYRCHLLGTAALNNNWRCDNFKLFNLTFSEGFFSLLELESHCSMIALAVSAEFWVGFFFFFPNK